MGKIRWTKKATGWVEKIYRYVAKDKPLAAQRLVQEIYHTAELLSDFPEIGYRLSDPQFQGLRVLLYGHYRIVYRLLKNKDVNIIGVYAGSLDLNKHLRTQ